MQLASVPRSDGRSPPSGLGLSLKALAADRVHGFRSFQRDFAKVVLESVMGTRSNPKSQGASLFVGHGDEYRTDLESALSSEPFSFSLSIVLCLPAAPDARPSAQHLLLERWLIDLAPRKDGTGSEWNQAGEFAKLNAFENDLRCSLRQLPLHALLVNSQPVSATYGKLAGEMTSFIQGGCAEQIYTLQTSQGTCRALLEHKGDLNSLTKERDFILAFVPQSTSVYAPCYHPPPSALKYAHSKDSPEMDRRASPSISINKLSLHSSDGVLTHNRKEYGRRGFSLASPPQLGSSPPVYHRLSSSSSAVGYSTARSPLSPPSDFGPFAGSMEESLLSGHVSSTACTVLSDFVADLVVTSKDDSLSPRDKARFPPHTQIPFEARYYHIGDTAPYVATLPLDERGYRIPARGTVQLTLRNPSGTPFKTFLVPFDLNAMPAETKTFIRQKISRGHPPRTAYAVHLRFSSPKAGVYFLAKRIKVIFPMRLPDEGEELRVSHDYPRDPQYFPY